jgi:glycosyltransferase involved in cell wall biosynthesis
MKKPNILLLWNEFSNMGGIERIIFNFLRHLDKEKYNVTVCCLFKGWGLHNTLLKEVEKFVPVVEIGADLNKTIDFNAVLKLTKLMKNLHIDIVRTYSVYANRYGPLAAWLADIRNVICSYHSIYNFSVSKKSFLLDSLILLNCKTFLVSSNHMKQHCLSRFMLNPKKIQIVNDSVDIDTIPNYSQEYLSKIKNSIGISDDNIVLISIGRLEKMKKFDLLIKALICINKKYPNVSLIIVGEGSQRDSLNNLVKINGLTEKIKFLGYQKEIWQFLALANIFILTSEYEGGPLVVLEAMAMGLPIVTTDVGNCRDMVIDKTEECGIVCPVGNVGTISEAVMTLIENREQREKMGNIARRRIEMKYSASKEMAFYNGLFDSLFTKSNISH